MSTRKRFLIKKNNVSDAVATFPELKAIDDEAFELNYFIGACGFEERILEVPTKLHNMKVIVKNGVLLGTYDTNPLDNDRRKKEFLPKLEKLNKNVAYFDAESPEETYRAISAALEKIGDGTKIKIGFDISGSSATLIVSTLLALVRTEKDIDLMVFYTTAGEYHEPVNAAIDEPVSVWSEGDLRERGVMDVSANELAPGIQHDHLPSYVIALPSMFPARLQRSLSFLGIGTVSGADENVYWILPATDDPKHQWRQAQVKISLLNMIYGSEDIDAMQQVLPYDQWGYCDVLDYRGCIRLVMSQIEEHQGSNISIIHSGTKVQAIGVALALAARREVALIKARPQAFSAEHYSTGVGTTYVIKLNNLMYFIQALAAVGSFNVESN